VGLRGGVVLRATGMTARRTWPTAGPAGTSSG
jgi:hypothetical protein